MLWSTYTEMTNFFKLGVNIQSV